MSTCSRSPATLIRQKAKQNTKLKKNKIHSAKIGQCPPPITYKLCAPDPKKLGFLQFLKQQTCYDLLPSSAKLVILDTELSVQKAFYALVFNNVRASILWNSEAQTFVGMLTITDFIKVLVNDYRKKLNQMDDYENSTISKWRSMDKSLEYQPLVSVSPESTLYDAARMLIQHRFHRLPIIDPKFGNPLHILTHKRILTYLYLNRHILPQDTFMSQSLEQLRLGTYVPDVRAILMNAPIIQALRLFLQHHISCLPVVDSENHLVELYAKFDVFNLAVTRTYNNLDENIYDALAFHRANRERYPRPMTCLKTATLGSVIERVVNFGIHRLVVVDEQDRLEGIISLSDILKFIVCQHSEADQLTDGYLRVPKRS